jgi:hypothetical protein
MATAPRKLAQPLRLLWEHAEDLRCKFEQTSKSSIRIRLEMPTPSGKPGRIYNLAALQRGAAIKVSEVSADGFRRTLPVACPERHINGDGAFCLFWGQRPIRVFDRESAILWWNNLINFLNAQAYAEQRRKWPEGAGRAHGDAAFHEANVEAIAEQFGPKMLADLKAKRIRLRPLRLGGRARRSLRLERNEVRLFAMWDSGRQIVNLRAACPCERAGRRKLPIAKCGDHAVLAARFIEEFQAMEQEERAFNEEWQRAGRGCCGTIENCPFHEATELAA